MLFQILLEVDFAVFFLYFCLFVIHKLRYLWSEMEIVPALSHVASAHTIEYNGVKPIFDDVEK